jgi:hypothetical protein
MRIVRRLASHTALALAEAGLIALLVAALVGGTALAGKPSRGGSATLGADCPCTTSQPVTVSGTGYDTSRAVVMLNFAGATTSTSVKADGSISHTWPYFSQPGTYLVKAYQSGRGGKMVLKAQTYVTVD